MSVISLLTDFGLQDEYVGLMKGVILSIAPGARIVDLCHQIDPQDVVQAAYLLQAGFSYFPEQTVHIAVVDPGVGTERAVLGARIADHLFVAPDNGLLAPLVQAFACQQLVRVENSACFLDGVSRTFHGRDIFAPVGAHLTNGLALSELGPDMAVDRIQTLHTPPVQEGGQTLEGRIIAVDRFGNLITNLFQERIQALEPTKAAVEIRFKGHLLSGIHATYGQVPPQTPLALIGSRGSLEIAVNQGDASRYFGADKGDSLWVSRKASRAGASSRS